MKSEAAVAILASEGLAQVAVSCQHARRSLFLFSNQTGVFFFSRKNICTQPLLRLWVVVITHFCTCWRHYSALKYSTNILLMAVVPLIYRRWLFFKSQI